MRELTSATTGRLALAAAMLLGAAGAAGAQTPYTAVGLGYPVPPVDGRAAALGGVGMSLPGGTLSFRNPADLTEFRTVNLGFTAAPEQATVTLPGGRTEETGRNRISVARAVVPAGEWRVAAGFASSLDQDWRVSLEDTLRTAAGPVEVDERRTSDGGVSEGSLAIARSIGPISLGIEGRRLTGSIRRSFRRTFRGDTLRPGPGLSDVTAAGNWTYEGWRARAGIQLQAGDRFRVGGTAGWGGELTADPDGPAEIRRYDLPERAAVGASLRPGGAWLLTAGAGWSGWSEADDELREAGAEDARWAGTGVEFAGWTAGPFQVPLRFGARVAELPFTRAGKEQASERAVTAGLGLVARGGRAVVDIGVAFGTRGDLQDAGIEEDFRRVTLSFQLRP